MEAYRGEGMKLVKATLSVGVFILALGCSKQPYHKEEFRQERIKQLHAHHKAWEGVWYRYGGTSKRGVDCSGYIYVTFKELFKMPVARTTRKQMRLGRRIDRAHLQAGDLIFFKTGYKQYHVGIYMDKGYFTHASSSKGVIRSSLKNPYWKRHYLFAKRILP